MEYLFGSAITLPTMTISIGINISIQCVRQRARAEKVAEPFKIVLTLVFWLDLGILDVLGTLLLDFRCLLDSKWAPIGLLDALGTLLLDFWTPFCWTSGPPKSSSLSRSGRF